MSARESMAVPALHTSPAASGWSESKPFVVARSYSTMSPLRPRSSMLRQRFAESAPVPKPLTWLIVQSWVR